MSSSHFNLIVFVHSLFLCILIKSRLRILIIQIMSRFILSTIQLISRAIYSEMNSSYDTILPVATHHFASTQMFQLARIQPI